MPNQPRLRDLMDKRVRYAHEIGLSIYVPLLLIMVNSVTSILHPSGRSWVDGLHSILTGGRQAQSYEGPSLRLAFALLWGAGAMVAFILLRLLSTFSFSTVLLRLFGGIAVVLGFPLAVGFISFRGRVHMHGSVWRALQYAYVPYSWLFLEVAASLVFVILCVIRKWPTKAKWGLPILVLHFALWTWLVALGAGSGHILLWPGYALTPLTRENPSLIYPLLGFIASLAWGAYVSFDSNTGQSRNVS